MRSYAHAPYYWDGETKTTSTSSRKATRAFGAALWKLGWGLLFVLVMTLLSELCPRLGPAKSASETQPVAGSPAAHSVK
jgi:hypothetical protein